VPVVTKVPPLGSQTIPPTGPGYYSFQELLEGDERQAPPKYPYPRFGLIPPSFFDMSFAYLDDPCNTDHDLLDCLKRIEVGEQFLFSAGGDVRSRYNYETNSRLTGVTNTYELFRARMYTDLWFEDKARIYVEGIFADSFDQNLNPLGIDINRGDLLNAFVDLKVLSTGEKDDPTYLRVGRQELLYGSQRLISTLDWANTRRTFQGAKVWHRSEKFDVDLFCVQPVPAQRNRFDSVDNNQVFTGLWATFRPKKGHNVDAFILNLDQTSPVATGQNGQRGGFNISTFGGRYYAREGDWLCDAEGMLQTGSVVDRGQFAGALSTGVGHVWSKHCMMPQVWVYYDYASGTDDGVTTRNTFNQLFPFGHYYLGFADLVGRQNIHDLNAQVAFYPMPWITALAQYHIFRLAEERDALYSAGGAVLRRDPTGRAGKEVGSELDFLVNFHLTTHMDLLVSYSHLFTGPFIKNTGSGAAANALYIQCSYRW